MEENKWMIVKKEKMSTKIKNYFKNMISKMLNNSNRKKKNQKEKSKKVNEVKINKEEFNKNNIKEEVKKHTKEKKKRKEILNKIRENKVDDYETISTKTKLSRGTIAVGDVDANELDPLIDLYRDSNKKLRNRINGGQ